LGNYPMTKHFFIDWPLMVMRSQDILSSVNAHMDPNQILRELSIGQKHMVGIARALSVDAKVVILDEPTAALSHHEIHEFYELVNTLKSQGKAILFITHKFDEIFTLADRYIVFRDGCYVGEGFIKDTSEAQLVEMMVARSIAATYPKKDVEIGETLLEVSNLCHTTEFSNISFSLKKGEILGVYGLVGSGRTEVMQALFGTTDHVTGSVKINGKEVIVHSPREAINNGIVYVPEERQKQGIVLELPIYQNVSLPQMDRLAKHGQIDQESERALARQYCERLQVKASCWDEKVMNLSGGNQQKVVIAKWLATNPKVMVFGEDVGPKGGVHGATLGLNEKFGDHRVFDTSLSEEGIIGRSVGMALSGLMPVPEIQFRKYAEPAAEQLSDTGIMRWRTNNQFAAPMVVRIPGGFSRRGDPWHSMSVEVEWAHKVGWQLAVPSHAEDAVGLLRYALRDNNPTIFFEHRSLLDNAWSRRPYPGDDFVIPFGKANTILTGTYLTVVWWGAMVERCENAAKELKSTTGKSIEVIDLRTLQPWDKDAVLSSVEKTGRCLIVHEDNKTAGFGAEIAAVLAEELFFSLDAPIQRLTMPDIPNPHNFLLLESAVPSEQKIAQALQNLIEVVGEGNEEIKDH